MELTDITRDNKTQGIPNPVRLLSLRQAARYLGRGEDSLRELVYSRAFPVVQLGQKSKLWLDIKDLDIWIDENKKYV